MPGPSTVSSSSENQRLAMRRSCVVTAGADEQMAISVTVDSQVESFEVEQLRERHGVFVRRSLDHRRSAPVISQSVLATRPREAHGVGRVGVRLAKKADQGLRVSHVHRKSTQPSTIESRDRCRADARRR